MVGSSLGSFLPLFRAERLWSFTVIALGAARLADTTHMICYQEYSMLSVLLKGADCIDGSRCVKGSS